MTGISGAFSQSADSMLFLGLLKYKAHKVNWYRFVLVLINDVVALLTAKHTMFDWVEYEENFKIYFANGEVHSVNPKIFIFPSDTKLDLAAARVPCDGKELSIPLAKSSAISITTPVKVFGYPAYNHLNDNYSGSGNMIEGIVTKYSASGNDAKNKGYNISYSAKTFPGFSGGPVLSSDLSELVAVHGYTFSVQPDPKNANINNIIDFDLMRLQMSKGSI